MALTSTVVMLMHTLRELAPSEPDEARVTIPKGARGSVVPAVALHS